MNNNELPILLLGVLLALVLGLLFGFHIEREAVSRDCERLGGFIFLKKNFVCSPKATP